MIILKERLDKILALNLNITRSEVKKLLKSGAVFVNGTAVRDGSEKLDPDADRLTVGGRKLALKRFVYIMLNKPEGVVSSTSDKLPTVIDILPEKLKRKSLFPAGRLDKDTTGFCLITDDGDFAHRILSPSKHVQKQYIAHVSGNIDIKAATEAFHKGVVLGDGTVLLEAELSFVGRGEDGNDIFKVTVSEGKYHQVKRMFASVGGKVERLKRISIGGLFLDEALLPGEARELTVDELSLVERGY